MNTHPPEQITTLDAPSNTPTETWRTVSSRVAHPSARVGGEPLVASIAAGLAEVSVPWELATGTTPHERCYQLLLSTDRYDAWLIHWPVGTGIDAHDHGGSAGAFAVVSGELDEDVTTDGSTLTRRLGPGDTVSFGDDHVHAVSNRGAVGATSVHVYAPPLRTMGFYRTEESGQLVIERIDDVDEARG